MTTAVAPIAVEPKNSWGPGDIFLLLAPILQVLQIKTVGLLYGTDLLLLAVLPVTFARSMNRLGQKQVRWFLLLSAVWLAFQVSTDILRGSTPADFLRGWSKIGLTITHFVVIWLLIRSSLRRFAIYGVGYCCGRILSTIFSPTPFEMEDPWKYGYGIAFTLLAVMGCSWLGRRFKTNMPVLVCMTGLAAVNFYMGFRSLGAVCLAALAYWHLRLRLYRLGRRFRDARAWMFVALLMSLFAIPEMYTYSVKQGWLGKDAQVKYRSQVGAGGILLGGRSEFLASSAAIADSPILGHGSWAKDPKYVAIMQERRAQLGYRLQSADSNEKTGLIPSHSHLFGAWVEAGIGGAMFWLWVLVLTGRALGRVDGREPMLLVFSFIGILLIWNVLFSPYGAEERFVATYFIAAMILLNSITEWIKRTEVEQACASLL